MAKTLTVTEAARNFSDVVNKVFYRGDSMELTRGGKVVARLVPAVDIEPPTGRQVLAAWKTMVHLTEDEAEAFAKDVESGRVVINQKPAGKWD
jgi:prevent-host-death family protein